MTTSNNGVAVHTMAKTWRKRTCEHHVRLSIVIVPLELVELDGVSGDHHGGVGKAAADGGAELSALARTFQTATNSLDYRF